MLGLAACTPEIVGRKSRAPAATQSPTKEVSQAKNLSIVSGDHQVAIVGQPLNQPLIVFVSDDLGNPVVGAPVTWSAPGGGAFVTLTEITDEFGNASATDFTLSTTAGLNPVIATVTGTSIHESFTDLVGVHDVSTNLAITGGNHQVTKVNSPFAEPFKVQVTDRYGNPTQSSSIVYWFVTSGDASLEFDRIYPNSDGDAWITVTAGATLGAHRIKASLDPSGTGSAEVTFDAEVQASPPSPPSPLSFLINALSPTQTPALELQIDPGPIPYQSWCILENDTDVNHCVFSEGDVPSQFSVLPISEPKTLSLWLKDSLGQVSGLLTSNPVDLEYHPCGFINRLLNASIPSGLSGEFLWTTTCNHFIIDNGALSSTNFNQSSGTASTGQLDSSTAGSKQEYYSYAGPETLVDFTPELGGKANGSLTELNGVLYGVLQSGGASQEGALYSFKPFDRATVRYSFSSQSSGGITPTGTLATDGQLLFGTTVQGGANSAGTIFSFDPSSNGVTILYEFDGFKGAYPQGNLLYDAASATLYGVTQSGGDFESGVLFRIGIEGRSFTILHHFGELNDGQVPVAPLVKIGNSLFGVTQLGGVYNMGRIYSYDLDQSQYLPLFDFNDSRALNPISGLVGDANNLKLYGTTSSKDPGVSGSLYSVDTFGNVEILHFFTSQEGRAFTTPILSGPRLIGTASEGGTLDLGTLYSYRTDTGNFTVLHEFQASEGTHPLASPLVFDTVLYGTTGTQGGNQFGTLYRILIDHLEFSIIPSPTLNSFTASPQRIHSGATTTLSWDVTGTKFNSIDGFLLDSTVGTLTKTPTTTTDFIFRAGQASSILTTDPDEILNSARFVDGYSAGFALTSNNGSNGGRILQIDPYSFLPLTRYTFNTSDVDTLGRNPREFEVVNGEIYGFTDQGGPNGSGTLFHLSGLNLEVISLDSIGISRSITALTQSSGILYGADQENHLFSYDPATGKKTILYTMVPGDGVGIKKLLAQGSTLYGLATSSGPEGGGDVFALVQDLNGNYGVSILLSGNTERIDQIKDITLEDGILFGVGLLRSGAAIAFRATPTLEVTMSSAVQSQKPVAIAAKEGLLYIKSVPNPSQSELWVTDYEFTYLKSSGSSDSSGTLESGSLSFGNDSVWLLGDHAITVIKKEGSESRSTRVTVTPPGGGGSLPPVGGTADSPLGTFSHPLYSPMGIKTQSGPSGAMRVDSQGLVYVTDTSRNWISVFDNTLDRIGGFGISGSEPGHLSSPVQITALDEHAIWIADPGEGGRIQRFNSHGTFLGSIKDGERTVGLAPFKGGLLQVTDSGKFRAWDFAAGSINISFNDLPNPGQVAVGPDDRIYLANPILNQVEIYTNGTLLTVFGSQGTEPGRFENLTGIAVDRNGWVYTADRTRGIQIFDSNHGYVDEIPQTGCTHVGVDSFGNIFTFDGQTVTKYVRTPQIPVMSDPATLISGYEHQGSAPNSVTLADLNGDGKQDFILSDSTGIHIFKNTTPPTEFPQLLPVLDIVTGQLAYQVSVGDFNEDGIQDLAFIPYGSDSITVYLGQGNFTFNIGNPLTFSLGFGIQGLIVKFADYDLDGHLDLIVSIPQLGTVRVLYGRGDGGILGSTELKTHGTWSTYFEVVDMNSDGAPDIVVLNQGSGTVGILYGRDPTGAQAYTDTVFQTPWITSQNLSGLAVGDLDHDGKRDIVVSDFVLNKAWVFLAKEGFTETGQGYELPGALSIDLADFNGDGNLDLISARHFTSASSLPNQEFVTLLTGNSNGTFEAPQLLAAPNSLIIRSAVADLNQDGMPEIVYTTPNGFNVIVNKNIRNPLKNQYVVLHEFNDSIKGSNPTGGLTLVDQNLFGVTLTGGEYESGVIYRMALDGSHYSVIHTFGETGAGDVTGPRGGLTYAQGYLYGTATDGGANYSGALFRIKPDGSDYQVLKSFPVPPTGGVVQFGKFLYGTLSATPNGPSMDDHGILYSFNLRNGEFADLHYFTGGMDGLSPMGTPIVFGNSLFAVTSAGGVNNAGLLYGYTPSAGQPFKSVYSFSFDTGAVPLGSLSRNGNLLYGYHWGNYKIYSYNLSSTEFHIALGLSGSLGDKFPPNSCPLVVSDPILGDRLFAQSNSGGTSGSGALFSINPSDGSSVQIHHSYSKPSTVPENDLTRTQLLFDRGTIYGVSGWDGSNSQGQVFRYSP